MHPHNCSHQTINFSLFPTVSRIDPARKLLPLASGLPPKVLAVVNAYKRVRSNSIQAVRKLEAQNFLETSAPQPTPCVKINENAKHEFTKLLTPKADDVQRSVSFTNLVETIRNQLTVPVPLQANRIVPPQACQNQLSPNVNYANHEDNHSHHTATTIKLSPEKQKTIHVKKVDKASAYKASCSKKTVADRQKLKEYNQQKAHGTLSDTDSKKRLNLIRQINSRRYRINNKNQLAGQADLIQSIKALATRNGDTQYLALIQEHEAKAESDSEAANSDFEMEE